MLESQQHGGNMTFTSAGLPNKGRTAHYQISYDATLTNVDGLNRATGLFDSCEQDFALMSSWFAGVNLEFSFPISVQIANASGGAVWSDPPDIALWFGFSPTVTIKPGGGTSVDFVRYLLVSEITEMFMASQRKGWYENTSIFSGADEGSKGEGLSRFLGVQFLVANGMPAIPFPGFGVVTLWLDSAPRPNFVDTNPDDNQPDATTGCTTCFLYFLHYQLGFSINAIIAAGADTLAGVFQNLTGKPDAFASFNNLLHSYYPEPWRYTPVGDNIFPVSELSQFLAPNQITCGSSQSTQIFLDKPAMAQVLIALTSDDPSVASVPDAAWVQVGEISATVPILAAEKVGPFSPISVLIHATYAGKTLTVIAQVVAPRLASLSISPNTVTAGSSSTATLSLVQPASSGDVVVDLVSSAPGFATVPSQVTIPQHQSSVKFTVTTPSNQTAFRTAKAAIYATYSGMSVSSVLTVNPTVLAGILAKLTVFPTAVTAAGTSRGVVTLVAPVTTPTVVGLAAFEPSSGPGGHLPLPSNASTVASVPPSLTIPAGRITSQFTITTNNKLAPGTKRVVSIMAVAVVTKYAILTVTP
jgi:hypothetical protein